MAIDNHKEKARVSFERSGKKTLKFYSCPLCGSKTKTIYLEIDHRGKSQLMLKCACGTLFYPGLKAPDYFEEEGHDSFFMRIDQAEGIDAIIAPMFLSPHLRSANVVDVGCGMGFGSDFLRFLGRTSIAFDPSRAAKMSTDVLGIEIHNTYVPETTVAIQAPILVFASEVIEHVGNPQKFLVNLKNIAGSEGYVILTTPNADFVTAAAKPETVATLLAPSQHLFLLSPASFTFLAKKVGFPWVQTVVNSDRLMLICGPKEIEVSDDFRREEYVSYLENRLSSMPVDTQLRHRIFGYRLFKEHIHSARYNEAEVVLGRLQKSYLGLGLNLFDPASVCEMFADASGSNYSLPPTEDFPFNVGIIFFLIATLKVAHDHDVVGAAPFANAALEIGNLYRKIFLDEGIFSSYDLENQMLAEWSETLIKTHSIPTQNIF